MRTSIKTTHKINFGKYRGRTFKWIAVFDPSYMEWLDNVPFYDFRLTKRLRKIMNESFNNERGWI